MEAVAVGYGTQVRSEITGSHLFYHKQEEIVSDSSAIVQSRHFVGRVAGVQVTNVSGQAEMLLQFVSEVQVTTSVVLSPILHSRWFSCWRH